MNSNNEKGPVGILELKWPDVALRLAAKMPGVHFDSGGSFEQTIDEFVVRQLLREILIDCLSNSFVTTKEVAYPDGKKRVDLMLGTKANKHIIALELKGDSAQLEEIPKDWTKLKGLKDQKHKLSIYSGIVEKSEYDKLAKKLKAMQERPEHIKIVQFLTKQETTFSSSSGIDENDICEIYLSFTWIWAIGSGKVDLPHISYTLY